MENIRRLHPRAPVFLFQHWVALEVLVREVLVRVDLVVEEIEMVELAREPELQPVADRH
jgi:hypothetical protein